MLTKIVVPALTLALAGVAFATDAPVFPAAKETRVAEANIVPTGATVKTRAGRSGLRYLACNEKRTYAGGEVELHCLSYSPTKGWGKSLRWYPQYQTAALKGELPGEPVVSPLK